MQQEVRENLNQDMKSFLQTSQWDQQVKDTTYDILEFRSQRPLLYLYEKLSLKPKLDQQSNIQQMIIDIALQTFKLDPIYLTKEQIITSILKILIEKHKIVRIKKFDSFKALLLLLHDCPGNKETKEYLIKQFNEKVDEQLNTNQFSRMIYVCFLVVKCFQEINDIIDIVKKKNGQQLTLNKLIWFIQEDSEQELSILSQLGVQSVLQNIYVKARQDQVIIINNIAIPLINMIIENHFD